MSDDDYDDEDEDWLSRHYAAVRARHTQACLDNATHAGWSIGADYHAQALDFAAQLLEDGNVACLCAEATLT